MYNVTFNDQIFNDDFFFLSTSATRVTIVQINFPIND